MGFEHSWILASLGVLLPLVWWLHRWYHRPRKVAVSSLRIWQDLGLETRFDLERWRPSLLLLLEGVVCVCLITVLAGPFQEVEAAAGQDWTVVLDRGPGMGATTVTGKRTRLQAAVADILEWVASAPGGSRIRVLTVPQAPGGPRIFEEVPGDLATYLNGLVPAGRAGDLEAVVRSRTHLDEPCLVVSDRGVAYGSTPEAGKPGRLQWLGVGAPGANVGIIWAGVTRSDRGQLHLEVGVMNGGHGRAHREVVVEAGEEPIRIRSLDLEPGEVWGKTGIPLPPSLEDRAFTLRLEPPDPLAADDEVRFRPVPSGEIAVVSEAVVPRPVIRALEALEVKVVHLGKQDEAPDLPALYWKVFPPADARAPLLLVAGPGQWSGLIFGASYVPQSLVQGESAGRDSGMKVHPDRVVQAYRVLQWKGWSVDLFGVDEKGARVPLILRREGIRVLAFNPVLEAPDWPERNAFPAFFYRVLGQAGQAYVVEGLLDASETRLGTFRAKPDQPGSGTSGLRSRRAGLQAWFLIAALLAVGSVLLLERR